MNKSLEKFSNTKTKNSLLGFSNLVMKSCHPFKDDLNHLIFYSSLYLTLIQFQIH